MRLKTLAGRVGFERRLARDPGANELSAHRFGYF